MCHITTAFSLQTVPQHIGSNVCFFKSLLVCVEVHFEGEVMTMTVVSVNREGEV